MPAGTQTGIWVNQARSPEASDDEATIDNNATPAPQSEGPGQRVFAASQIGPVVTPRVTRSTRLVSARRHKLLEIRRVGWDEKQPVFRPIRHAWRVEVAHGRLGRSRRLAKSFENTTNSATGWLQVACIATTLRYLSRERARRPAARAA